MGAEVQGNRSWSVVRCHHTCALGPVHGGQGRAASPEAGRCRSIVAPVTGDGEDTEDGGLDARTSRDGTGAPRPRLRCVDGPLPGAEPPPHVHLRREFKGLTVADLLRPEIVDRLPGQVRSVIHHLQRGDLQAAEQAMPGDFAPVLRGPGHGRLSRRLFGRSLFFGVVLSIAVAWWWFR